MKLDPNRTIWQRIQDRCEPAFGREVADQIASLLLPYVVAERKEVLERSGSFVPFHVLNKVGIVNFNDCCRAYVASLNGGRTTVGGSELKGSFGDSHDSPFVSGSTVGAVDSGKDTLGVVAGVSLSPWGASATSESEVSA